MGEQSQSFFHAGNLICLLHLATDVVLKQLVSKSRVIQISRHIPWCMTLVMEIFPLLWLREFNLCEKKTCCAFTTGSTRLLPCTGASRTASWLFETWFGAAGGGRDGHSSVHSGGGREGNVTCFTSALRVRACTHTGSVRFEHRKHEKHGKSGKSHGKKK